MGGNWQWGIVRPARGAGREAGITRGRAASSGAKGRRMRGPSARVFHPEPGALRARQRFWETRQRSLLSAWIRLQARAVDAARPPSARAWKGGSKKRGALSGAEGPRTGLNPVSWSAAVPRLHGVLPCFLCLPHRPVRRRATAENPACPAGGQAGAARCARNGAAFPPSGSPRAAALAVSRLHSARARAGERRLDRAAGGSQGRVSLRGISSRV